MTGNSRAVKSFALLYLKARIVRVQGAVIGDIETKLAHIPAGCFACSGLKYRVNAFQHIPEIIFPDEKSAPLHPFFQTAAQIPVVKSELQGRRYLIKAGENFIQTTVGSIVGRKPGSAYRQIDLFESIIGPPGIP